MKLFTQKIGDRLTLNLESLGSNAYRCFALHTPEKAQKEDLGLFMFQAADPTDLLTATVRLGRALLLEYQRQSTEEVMERLRKLQRHLERAGRFEVLATATRMELEAIKRA